MTPRPLRPEDLNRAPSPPAVPPAVYAAGQAEGDMAPALSAAHGAGLALAALVAFHAARDRARPSGERARLVAEGVRLWSLSRPIGGAA